MTTVSIASVASQATSFAEHLYNLHYIWMMHLCLVLGLATELVPVIGHDSAVRALHAAAICGSAVHVGHEELFDGYVNVNAYLAQWTVNGSLRSG